MSGTVLESAVGLNTATCCQLCMVLQTFALIILIKHFNTADCCSCKQIMCSPGVSMQGRLSRLHGRVRATVMSEVTFAVTADVSLKLFQNQRISQVPRILFTRKRELRAGGRSRQAVNVNGPVLHWRSLRCVWGENEEECSFVFKFTAR